MGYFVKRYLFLLDFRFVEVRSIGTQSQGNGEPIHIRKKQTPTHPPAQCSVGTCARVGQVLHARQRESKYPNLLSRKLSEGRLFPRMHCGLGFSVLCERRLTNISNVLLPLAS